MSKRRTCPHSQPCDACEGDWQRRLWRRQELARGTHLATMGLDAERLRWSHADRERAFNLAWRKEHGPRGRDLLFLLLTRESGPPFGGGLRTLRPEVGPVTRRDRLIAATLIQWLGTNVGWGFLTDTLKRCGYEIRDVLKVRGISPPRPRRRAA